MNDIEKRIALATKGWNVNDVVNAVIADDPDASEIKESLSEALIQTKKGNISRENKIRAFTR